MRAAIIAFVTILTASALVGLTGIVLGFASNTFFMDRISEIKGGGILFLASLLIFVIVFPLILWRTPAEMQREDKDRINELEPETERPKSKKALY